MEIVGSTLIVAMAEPEANGQAMASLASATSMKIEPVRAKDQDIRGAIRRWYAAPRMV